MVGNPQQTDGNDRFHPRAIGTITEPTSQASAPMKLDIAWHELAN